MPAHASETTPALAYLGLGGNIGDVKKSFSRALQTLNDSAASLCRCSRLYTTSPWGIVDQPTFLNMAVEIGWNDTAHELFALIEKIEQRSGRVRDAENRWGPRSLDIDILLLGDLQVDDEQLSIPHPRMHERNFVLVPLLDLLPRQTIIPSYQRSLGELHDQCSDTGDIRPLSEGPWDEWRETNSPT